MDIYCHIWFFIRYNNIVTTKYNAFFFNFPSQKRKLFKVKNFSKYALEALARLDKTSKHKRLAASEQHSKIGVTELAILKQFPYLALV